MQQQAVQRRVLVLHQMQPHVPDARHGLAGPEQAHGLVEPEAVVSQLPQADGQGKQE